MLQSLSSKDCPTSLRHGNRHSFGRRCNARQLEHDPVASFCIRLDLLCGGGGSFECRLLTQCRTSRSDLPAFFAKLDMIWCAGVSNKCTTTATSCYIILHPRHEHVPICANMCHVPQDLQKKLQQAPALAALGREHVRTCPWSSWSVQAAESIEALESEHDALLLEAL